MTSSLDSGAPSAGDRRRSVAYAKDFWPCVAAYLVVLAAMLTWGHLDGTSPWRFVWALAPVVPALATVRAVSRHLRRVDDFQRLVLLRGLAVGFGSAMVAAVAMGFLDLAGTSGFLTAWIIVAVGMTGWIVGAAAVSRA